MKAQPAPPIEESYLENFLKARASSAKEQCGPCLQESSVSLYCASEEGMMLPVRLGVALVLAPDGEGHTHTHTYSFRVALCSLKTKQRGACGRQLAVDCSVLGEHLAC